MNFVLLKILEANFGIPFKDSGIVLYSQIDH